MDTISVVGDLESCILLYHNIMPGLEVCSIDFAL